MTVPIEIRKRAIALVEQLPGESLVKAVEFLESLSDEALQGSQMNRSGVVNLRRLLRSANLHRQELIEGGD
jgi:hypothetical protein